MIAELVMQYAVPFINHLGYPGIFFLMFLESTIVPIPSEAVLPFAGFLVSEGKLSLLFLSLIVGLASLAGAIFSYFIGYYGGEPLIRKYGKYFLVNEEDLRKSEQWFKRHGGKTIFFSRFIVGVRHVISIPAGASKMNLIKFSLLTFIGAYVWNLFLIIIGFYLKSRWQMVLKYTNIVDIIVLLIVILLIIAFVLYKLKSKNKGSYFYIPDNTKNKLF